MPADPPRSRMTRWRAGSLIVVHLLIGLHFLHWQMAGRTLAPIEPSEMFDTLHLGILTVGFLFMAGMVLATSLVGRFFCSWGCHILALQDLSAWLLGKLGIRATPIRSRVLLWVPPLAVVYLFVWPQLQRLLQGQALPALHVVTDPDGWTSFTTTDLLRSFPGLGMTLFTFALCGFAMVYFLGSRSFCSYACPYGAIFAGAERLAPLRIIAGPGECSQCNLCMTSCMSSVRVIEEVQQFGAVLNSHCMKDLDCISVCPTDALKIGFTKPPLLRSWRGPRAAARGYDFSMGEDLLMAGVFVFTLPVIRGLYDAVSLLLALAMTALLAYFVVVSLRLVREPGVRLGNFQLKVARKLTPVGWGFALLVSLLGLLLLHSTFIRYHRVAGQHALAQWQPSLNSNRQDPAVSESDHAIVSPGIALRVEAKALAHLELAYRWGLFRPPGLRRELATIYLQAGWPAKARGQLVALLGQDPGDLVNRLRLGRLWLQEGHLNLARQQFEQTLAALGDSSEPAGRTWHERIVRGSAHFSLGDVEARRGRQQQALRQFALAVRDNPQDAEALLALGAMQAATGRLEEAAASFQASLQLRPDSAAAHNNLAAILVRLGRKEGALEHYRQSLARLPDNPQACCQAGLLLVDLGKLDEAEGLFRQALACQPNDVTAHAGLAKVFARRGEPEKAAWHRRQAARLHRQALPAGQQAP